MICNQRVNISSFATSIPVGHCVIITIGLGERMDEQPPENPVMDMPERLSKDDMVKLLERLKKEHRAIDREIKASFETGVTDMLKMRRMKKVKLAMKDKISFIENQITPDIIA